MSKVVNGELILFANGVEVCAQTFGEFGDPAVLLIGGMSSSMDWWEDGFCERLAAGGRHVVHYDFRDTGRSTTYPPGRPAYTGADLRDDGVALLDALAIESAHLVGVSMGGVIAQCVAIERPERVMSLTLIANTAALPGAPDGLPAMDPELAAHFDAARQRPEPDWTDREAVAAKLIEDQLSCSVRRRSTRADTIGNGSTAANPCLMNGSVATPGRTGVATPPPPG